MTSVFHVSSNSLVTYPSSLSEATLMICSIQFKCFQSIACEDGMRISKGTSSASLTRFHGYSTHHSKAGPVLDRLLP